MEKLSEQRQRRWGELCAGRRGPGRGGPPKVIGDLLSHLSPFLDLDKGRHTFLGVGGAMETFRSRLEAPGSLCPSMSNTGGDPSCTSGTGRKWGEWAPGSWGAFCSVLLLLPPSCSPPCLLPGPRPLGVTSPQRHKPRAFSHPGR